MQYLVAMEGLRSQCYDILHRFSDPVLQREVTVFNATEVHLTDPHAEESYGSPHKNSKGIVTYNSLVTQGAPSLYLISSCRVAKCQVLRVPVAPEYDSPSPLARRLAQRLMPAASKPTTPVSRQAATSVQRARCLQFFPDERPIYDPDCQPQQIAEAAVPVPAALVKSGTTEVNADCPTSSIQ